MVIDMTVTADGEVSAREIYRAMVVNRAKLAYDSVAAWLDGSGPRAGARSPRVAGDGRAAAHPGPGRAGAEAACARAPARSVSTTLEAQAVYDGAALLDLRPDEDNRAKELIEYFMIAANGVVARFLEAKRSPSLRRVLREPERWERIVRARPRPRARACRPRPMRKALSGFLGQQRQAAHRRSFPDLSLAVVKLLGRRRVRAQAPGRAGRGALRAGGE